MDIFDLFVHKEMHRQIDASRHEALNADLATMRLEARVRVLEQSSAALWALLKIKTGWTDEELIDQAKQMQGTHAPGACPACGRAVLIQNSTVCAWCGQPLPKS